MGGGDFKSVLLHNPINSYIFRNRRLTKTTLFWQSLAKIVRNPDTMTKPLAQPYKVVTSNRCLLGEGPVWDSQRQVIYWLDILNGIIHEHSPSKNSHRQIPLNDMVGAVALCKNGDFIAAMKSGLAIVEQDSGAVKPLVDPESHLPGNRFNEGKCDPAGRFWAGTMALSEVEGAGNLYMLDTDGACSLKIPGVSISNGLAWASDHKTMYYIDSPTRKVVAYDYSQATGGISNQRVAISIPEEEGSPDGMTIDSEGMLWIGHWDGWQVARWNPLTGQKLLSIGMPAARITSCTFGGETLQDLYITSARVGLTDEQLEEQPLAGSLFVVENCGFKGMEAVKFGYSEASL